MLIEGASTKPPSKAAGKSVETAVAGEWVDEKVGEEKVGEADADEGGE